MRTEVDADSMRLTRAGVVLGTPPYMSPEQFAGHPLDRRSDVYSLGVMAYEMLTGRLPFKGTTPWEWATQHLSADPHPFADTPAGATIPGPLRRVVLRALSKRVDERPATALEMHELMAEAAQARDSLADRTSPSTPIAPAPSRVSSASGLPRTQEVPTAPPEPPEPARRSSSIVVILVCLVAMAAGMAIGTLLLHAGILEIPQCATP
jgi:serine/threonine-protein kinase